MYLFFSAAIIRFRVQGVMDGRMRELNVYISITTAWI